MKTSFLIVLTFLMTTLGLQAQHANIGIKGGLNAYNIQGDNSSDNEYKLGYHIGLLAHFHIADQFGLQPEAYYSVQGTSFKLNGDEIDLNLSYVNIPLNFQYMFDNGFRLQAGPQLGILASANLKNGSNSVDVKSDFKGIDLGLTVGMSYVKPSTGFGFDIRYNHGLTNINEDSGSEFFNRGFQVGLFYLFQHKS